MNNTAFDILNDPELLQLRDAHMHRLQNLFDGQSDSRAFVLLGVCGHGQCDLYTEPEQWLNEALDDLASKAKGLRDPVVFRPLSINPWPYGVHFIDKLFGATVYELDGETDNWQAEYLARPVGGLEFPDIDTHPAVVLARRIATAFVEAEVSLPFFAPPVLSSPLNIALNLYGQEFLIAMLTEPEAARHDPFVRVAYPAHPGLAGDAVVAGGAAQRSGSGRHWPFLRGIAA